MERILTSAEARTVPLSRNPIRRLAQLAELGSHISGIRIGPVSYTHLDVYKRQA